MIYYILRFCARMGLWINFRKIYLEYTERIPAETTVIFALNHPTAFMEPIAVGTHVDASCWYMLRGDKFINKPVKWFLHKIQNLPIWRERDGGRAAARGNVATMAYATDKVLEGEPTVILCEGTWSPGRRLRPVQRGTARMLFQAWRKDKKKPVAIVPVGVNYTAPNKFRSSLTLSYGEPIYAADYAEQRKDDARAAELAVTEELTRRLRKLIITVEDGSRDNVVESVLPLIQHDRPDAGLMPATKGAPFREAQWRATEAINHLEEFEFRQLAGRVDTYESLLKRHNITDSGVALPGYGALWRAALLVLLGPLAVLALFINYVPAAIAQRQAAGQLRNEQFYGSVRYGLGMAIYAIYVLLWTVVAAFIVGWWSLLLPPLMLLSAHFFLQWSGAVTLWKQSARINSLDEAQLAQVKAARADVLEGLG